MPEQFDKVAAASTEGVQRAVERVLCQPLLHQLGKTRNALPHAGDTAGQGDPQTRRRRNHRPDSAASTRHSAPWSTAAPTRTTIPLDSTISIRPSRSPGEDALAPPSDSEVPPFGSAGTAAGIAAPASAGTTSTQAKPDAGCGATVPSSPRTSCCRQVYSRPL